jgi:toluene monooxygenase system protein A
VEPEPVPKLEDWLPLARKLDWEYSYVSEAEVFPAVASGRPWLPHSEWQHWDEPYHVPCGEYCVGQSAKDDSIDAVREAFGKLDDYKALSEPWVNGLKLHAATLPLAEFAAVVGNLRGARFARDGAWRASCTLAALDEVRHTHIPLALMHELVRWDPQFDWTHKFYHSNNWVAVAARHLTDELLLAGNPIDFAIATNFVFETGFTNLQFVGLSSLAREAGDTMFEKMTNSIQSDEARHSMIGHPVLATVVKHDPEYAQYLLDKWFWRSWLLFAIVTGFSMDYLTPLAQRRFSFKEFVQEWVIDQYERTLAEFGVRRPWYWDQFIDSLDSYHHMVYASAYTYRATVWFNMVVPSPDERAWLRERYPRHWDRFDAVWEQVGACWSKADPRNEFAVHGTAIVGFCDLCQLVLCNGTPDANSANTLDYNGRKYIFCSQPCRWIFEHEPDRYAQHKDIVKRVLAGEAPANLIAMLRQYFGLDYQHWGKDVYGGDYPWLQRAQGGKGWTIPEKG